jgi:predicted DNA-binding transcriptional regulator YafY
MARSTGSQKAERLNAAHGLLARGLSVAQACVVLSGRFELSRRQAYRYVQEAQALAAPVPLTEPSVAVTFKLPPRLVNGVRARAAADRTTISETVSRALSAYLSGPGGHGA